MDMVLRFIPVDMGSSRNHSRKVKPQSSRRSRSQRLRRIREKCEKELLIAAQSTVSGLVNSETKRNTIDDGINELHTFSEIIIPTTSDASDSAGQDKGLNHMPQTSEFANIVCKSPLSTPLLDSKISSYINYHSRMQFDMEDPSPELGAAHDDVSGNLLLPGRAVFNTGHDKVVGKGGHYARNKRKCGEVTILSSEKAM